MRQWFDYGQKGTRNPWSSYIRHLCIFSFVSYFLLSLLLLLLLIYKVIAIIASIRMFVCFRWYFFGGANQYTQTHNKRYMIFILYLIDNDCLSFDRRKIKNLNRATHPNITRFETKPLCADVSVCVEGNRQPKTTKKYLERERETENGYKWEKQIMCMLKSH